MMWSDLRSDYVPLIDTIADPRGEATVASFCQYVASREETNRSNPGFLEDLRRPGRHGAWKIM